MREADYFSRASWQITDATGYIGPRSMTVTEMPPQGKFVSQGQRYSESPFFLRRDPPDPHRSHVVADPAFLQQAQAALVDPENTCRYPSRARGRVPAENARHRMAAAPSRVSFLQVGHSLPRLEPYEKWSASRFFEVHGMPPLVAAENFPPPTYIFFLRPGKSASTFSVHQKGGDPVGILHWTGEVIVA